MENNFNTIALLVMIVVAILQFVINNIFNKRIKHLEKSDINRATAQTMLAYQFQEFIIEDLELKSKGRDLTDLERSQFQSAREMLYEIENRLTKAVYEKNNRSENQSYNA